MQQAPPTVSADGYWMWDGVSWVPNPQRPQAYTRPVVPYASAQGRAQLASILVGVSILGSVLLMSATVLIDLVPEPGDDQLLALGLFDLFAIGVWAVTWVAAIVAFCVWLHRVIRNMPALGSLDPRWSPSRAIVYCFVPIIWLVHPLRSVLDVWRGSDPSWRWIDLSMRKTIRTPALMVGWWALWLIGNYSVNLGSRLHDATAATLHIAGGICTVGASVLCIAIIRELTARQERKQELIASGRLA